MIPTATLVTSQGPRVRCVLDRHLGPFEPLPELAGFLGTDWYCCLACRSPLTRVTVLAQRAAA
ncbi:MAG TPA: hypothetical protein VFQ39_16235 [Longimicrobium sp.]|nr:hypothetical protein [Longimicrobium sp.]